MSDLAHKRCAPCEGGVAPLSTEQVAAHLKQVNGWTLEGAQISKTYRCKNYHEVMAFVNATAWISHREDHHPDLQVGFNTCRVVYWTHAINGLSENDFICAAKIDALFSL